MKTFLRIFAQVVILLMITPCLSAQEVKVIRRQIDSLKQSKTRINAIIAVYEDSIKQIEIDIGRLIRKQSDEEMIASEQAKINEYLGTYGMPIKLVATCTMLDSPNDSAKQILTIEARQKVQVLALESYPYYRVIYKKKQGYLRAQCIDFGISIAKMNVFIHSKRFGEETYFQSLTNNPPPNTTPSKDHSPNKSTQPKSSKSTQQRSSTCGSVQCSGKTQKGSRCKNRTTNCSGRCYLH